MITDTLLVFDNLKQKVMVVSNVFLNGQQSLEEAYEAAQEKIGRIISHLQSQVPPSARKGLPLLLSFAQISARKIL